MQKKIDDLINFRNAPTNGHVSSVPNNTSSLTGPDWTPDKISFELGLRLRQQAAVDEVDMWVADVQGCTVDDYFDTVYQGGGSSTAHLAKGAYGEMKADLYFTEVLGYRPVATGHPRADSLESGHGQNGIDGLYQTPDGEYVVIEVKPNDGGTSAVSDGDRQMSDRWITERLPIELKNNEEELLNILDGDRLLINYDSKANGSLTSRDLDESGRIASQSVRL